MVNFVKINEKLPLIFFVIGYITVFFVTAVVADTITKISYALLTLLSVFLGFLIVKDVIHKYKEKYETRKKEIQGLIDRSIEKEKDEKTAYKDKISELDRRKNLYEKLERLSPKEISIAAFFSFIFLILSLLFSSFVAPLDTALNLPIKSYHVSYILFIIAVFFIIRLLAVFLSIVSEE